MDGRRPAAGGGYPDDRVRFGRPEARHLQGSGNGQRWRTDRQLLGHGHGSRAAEPSAHDRVSDHQLDVAAGGTAELRVRTSDPDNDKTTVTWSATGGTVSGSGDTATFNSTGLRAGTYTVTATVDDGRGGRASCNMTVNVSERMTLPCSFRVGSARLDNKCKAALDDIAVRMQSDTRLRANIIGYTDDSRQDKGLGIKRAQAAADYLRKKQIDASRLTTTDGGTSKPVADNKTAAGRSGQSPRRN